MVAKAAVGQDAGLFVQEEMTGAMAVSCTSLAGSEEGLAVLAVKRACNSLAASGAKPSAVTVQLMLSESAEERELKDRMQEVLSACAETDTALVNGHTQVSSFVTEPVISVTAMVFASEVSFTSVIISLDIGASILLTTWKSTTLKNICDFVIPKTWPASY